MMHIVDKNLSYGKRYMFQSVKSLQTVKEIDLFAYENHDNYFPLFVMQLRPIFLPYENYPIDWSKQTGGFYVMETLVLTETK